MRHGHALAGRYRTPAVAALVVAVVAACAVEPTAPPPPTRPIRHVIHISVDGLRPDAVTALGRDLAPNFFRLREEGAFTDNARTDVDVASTLPNHASQLTGRGVLGDDGHGLLLNDDPGPPTTLRLIEGGYVASVLDVVHDAGLPTGFYASKSKFAIFDRSWNEIFGARDETGADNGRDKTDVTFIDRSMDDMVSRFVADMAERRYAYAFVHFRKPDDPTGHSRNWDLTPGSDYLQAVVEVDGLLGRMLGFMDADPELADTTAIILTADHGGELGRNFHLLAPNIGFIDSGIVPFYVRGPGIPAGGDLYVLNADTRADPGGSIPSYSASPQPIRNGDAANLALDLLGLPPVPKSTINADQSLVVRN